MSNPLGIGYDPARLITTTPLTTQVDRLLALKPTLDAGDLIFLWAGANDGLVQFSNVSTGTTTPTAALTELATEAGVVAQQVQRLRAAGGK